MGLPGPNVVDGSTSFANGVIPGNAFQFPLTQPGLGDFNDGVRGDNGFGDGRGFLGSSTGGIRGETDFGSDYGVRGIHTGGNVAVRADGNSETTGTKSFVQPHPTDATLQIVFISAEGPESYTMFRGTVQLVNGVADIVPREDWRLVTSDEADVSVLVTPLGPASVWVEQQSREQIVIRGTADVEVTFLVLGVRYGFENHQTIQANTVTPIYKGAPYGLGFTQKYQQLLIDNGTVNPDLTPNEATAAALGWRLEDAPPGLLKNLEKNQGQGNGGGQGPGSNNGVRRRPNANPQP